jgi:hypothetical protein
MPFISKVAFHGYATVVIYSRASSYQAHLIFISVGFSRSRIHFNRFFRSSTAWPLEEISKQVDLWVLQSM